VLVVSLVVWLMTWLVVSLIDSLVVCLIDSEVVPLPKGAEVVTGGEVTAGGDVSTAAVLEDVSMALVEEVVLSTPLVEEVVLSTPLVGDVVVETTPLVGLVDEGLVVVVLGGFVLEELQSKVMEWMSMLQVVLV
jgi:hypothetical protein